MTLEVVMKCSDSLLSVNIRIDFIKLTDNLTSLWEKQGMHNTSGCTYKNKNCVEIYVKLM